MSLSKEVIYGIIALVIGIGSVSAIVLYQQYAGVKSMMKVHYMRDGVEIGSATGPLAVIGEHEGVTHIYFTITVTNTGEFPLTMYITAAEPYQFDSALASATSAIIDLGQSHSWDSDLIDVSPFVDTTTTFTVHTKGEYTYAEETNTLTKDASIDLTVYPDPLGGYDVIIESSTGEQGGGGATTTTPITPTTTTPLVTTTPTCWTAGTTCDPVNHECCNICEGRTKETKSPLSCSDYSNIGQGCTDGVVRTTSVSFNCPGVSTPEVPVVRCEIYQVEEKVGASSWNPITPVLIKSCSPGTTCTHTTTTSHGWKGYVVEEITTYACT